MPSLLESDFARMSNPTDTQNQAGWDLPDLVTRARLTPREPVRSVRVTALTDDSREVVAGACFVAVQGTGIDGHRFVDAAVRGGAVAVVVDQDVALPACVVEVRVSDSREALARLAAVFHGVSGQTAASLCLVGITGTNGKTTVSWLLRSILRAAGHKVALFGTVEYDLVSRRLAAPLTTPGPLTLARHLAETRRAGATHAVLEVSSHALDQRRCDGLAFSAGVFTNLSGDHLDYHGTMEAYADAKCRLFELLSPEGSAVVNADDAVGASLLDRLDRRPISFGLDGGGADVSASILEMGARGTRLTLRGRFFEVSVRLPLIGRHNVHNALAAAATAEAIGIAPDAIRDGLEGVTDVPGRLQRVEPEGWPFSVLVDYAHTDAALANVLAAVRPVTTGRLICVFGCGGDRDRSKRPRMAAAVGQVADLAVVTSDNPRSEPPDRIIDEIMPGFADASSCVVARQADRRRAIEAAIAMAAPGDTVLIAGKGHEDYQLVGDAVLAFDDAAEARRCLAKVVAREEVA